MSWVLLLGAMLPAIAAAKCGNVCETLELALPGLVTFPNTTLYALENSYWSARQSEARPSCFVTPRSAKDVATAMQVLVSKNAPFTVKSGGHTAFEGGSNIDQGVTVDLLYLTDISVSTDRQTVSVGAGNRWVQVSEVLDPLGLAVVGGRASTVGVSGLILGGGISYFSGRRGWACDNVRNFEVVTVTGAIVNASPDSNQDLYWALRGGGGSNFGIVTRFDLVSFEQGDLWASSLVYPGAMNQTLIPILQDLIVNGLPADPGAHTYFVMAYVPTFGGFIVLSDQFHDNPVDSVPEIFKPFHEIPVVLANNTRHANVSQLSRDIAGDSGLRQTWAATSVLATSAQLLLDFVPLYEAHVARLLAAAGQSLVIPYFIYQPISVNILQAMQVNGGNALGISPEDGPLVIVQLSVSWVDASLDDVVLSSRDRLLAEVNALAEERGLKKGFVYMNYAGENQDVQGSYGPANAARLREIAQKWDPRGKLKNLWKGYFKV
ncbi:hypothetical protein QBC35DRAFT_439900 [Podospora australis]|uniref:FAD-binding PCMH-type domain-containing protein n=1 Tax=Podospora australis TaxID=1536484 RepID=A0AAN6WNF2_9PEZI|nr:hypothetical protein QBC35DRAFT_439900 [Podospora australis]